MSIFRNKWLTGLILALSVVLLGATPMARKWASKWYEKHFIGAAGNGGLKLVGTDCFAEQPVASPAIKRQLDDALGGTEPDAPGQGIIAKGYVARVDASGGVLGPGTSVVAADRIGFAVTARQAADIQPEIANSAGRVVATLPSAHVAPHATLTQRPWADGSDYPIAFTWQVPTGLPSGIYYLVQQPAIFFIVREPKPAQSPVVVLVPTNTINAYTKTLGRSLYARPCETPMVSFLRPQSSGRAHALSAFERWAEEQNAFATRPVYAADADMDDPALLDGAKVLIVLWHSEYWTRAARLNFDAFVARGGNVIMAGGNDMWWQVRYSDDHTALISYKTLAERPSSQGGDPVSDPLLRTVGWHSTDLDLSIVHSLGGSYDFGGLGQRGKNNGLFKSAYTVAEPDSPLLAGTGLKICDLIEMPMSGEYDGAPIIGLDDIGRPVPDLKSIGAYRYELLGYEWNKNEGYQIGTMHIMQRTPQSGYVLHMGALNCCITQEFYMDTTQGATNVQKIVSNAVKAFLTHADPLANAPPPRPVAFPMTTPWNSPLPAVPANACAPSVGREPAGPTLAEGEGG